MPKFPKPFFRGGRGWYVQIGKQQVKLADGPENKETEAAALKRYHEVMIDSGRVKSATGMTVAEVCDKFLDWTKSHREPRTFNDYLEYIQDFTNHLADRATMPVANLRPFHITEWVDTHPAWNDTTRRKAMIHVQRPFNWAAKLGYIPDNPVRHIEKPQAKRRDNPATPEDFSLMLSKVEEGDPFRDLLEFNWFAGVRPQEARHIEGRHVHLDAECIVIPKEEAKGKKRPRVIYLHGRSLEIITRLLSRYPSGKLFRNSDGQAWKTFAICNRFTRLSLSLAIDTLTEKGIPIPTLPRFDRRKFKNPVKLAAARERHKQALIERNKEINRLAREHGKGLAAYDLRHGFADRKLAEGHDHLSVAELLGHKDGTMLARVYQHLHRNTQHLKKVLAG